MELHVSPFHGCVLAARRTTRTSGRVSRQVVSREQRFRPRRAAVDVEGGFDVEAMRLR